MIFELQPVAPYDFALTAVCSRLYTATQAVAGGALLRRFAFLRGAALVEVTAAGNVEAPALRAVVTQAEGELDADALASVLRGWLATDADLRGFYAAAAGDPVLARLVARLYGLHLLRTPTVFEALLVTIIEQQIALSAAQKAERWLAGTYGTRFEGSDLVTFPTPERIAALSETDLAPLKITFIRIRRILAIARAVADGALDLEALRAVPTDAAYQRLLALDGIGHWTASWTLTRAFGVYRYVGSADVALRAAVNHYWHGQKGRADRAVTDAHFAAYGRYAGEACVYTLLALGLERYPARSSSTPELPQQGALSE